MKNELTPVMSLATSLTTGLLAGLLSASIAMADPEGATVRGPVRTAPVKPPVKAPVPDKTPAKPPVKAPTKIAPAGQPPLELVLLSEARKDLKPQAYTADERTLMANQALLLIKNMYVHRELKITDFGAQVDPVPRLQDMVKKAGGMKDEDFQSAMQKIFLDLHDHHTNYIAPMPLRCSYVLAPIRFADVYDNGALKIIVKGPAKWAAKITPKELQPGDELLAMNGKPIASVLEDLKAYSGGANPDAMTAGAVMNLAMIPLAEQPIPAANDLVYTLKHGDKQYTVKTSYVAAVNIKACADQIDGSDTDRRRSSVRSLIENAENPIVRDYKDLVEPTPAEPFADDDSTLPIGKIYTIKTPAGTLTKLDITTFMPEGNASSDQIIQQIKSKLQVLQASSSALVIDIRSNGGGSIILAEGLTQLFTPGVVKTMPVRFLPSQLNYAVFVASNSGEENSWSKDTKDAMKAGARYTNPRIITSPEVANRYGQVWFKPVVVLTDANCYSACDLFAASMQDHGAATIIGVHASTGAGGANVMDYQTFKMIADTASPHNNPFYPLPGKQDMRVSWRQTLRVGKNDGKLIEDAGVKSDIVVRYQTADVLNGESPLLMKAVSDAISKILPRYASAISLKSSLMMNNGDPAVWSEAVKGVDTVEISQKGKVIGTTKVDPAGQVIQLTFDGIKAAWADQKFTVVGKLNGNPQFRVVRVVRWRGQPLDASKPLMEPMVKDLNFWHTFQFGGQPDQGWQLRNKVIRVGKGPQYAPNTNAELFATIDTRGKSTLTLNMSLSLDTEQMMDFFNIIVRNPVTGQEFYVASMSGAQKLQKNGLMKLQIPQADETEVVFQFTSDENWNMAGPIISKLGILAE